VVKRKVIENGREVEKEEHDNLLSDESYSVGSEIKDGYPEFTHSVLRHRPCIAFPASVLAPAVPASGLAQAIPSARRAQAQAVVARRQTARFHWRLPATASAGRSRTLGWDDGYLVLA
jgi:hypothetical protein